jgi:hypothetical protein
MLKNISEKLFREIFLVMLEIAGSGSLVAGVCVAKIKCQKLINET